MAREVAGAYGQSYRIHPDDPCIVQVKPGYKRRWKLFRECETAADALAVRDGRGPSGGRGAEGGEE